uniref:trypsin n=1 Tax=Anopheles christyi TaxID=43041 RepID=A0A182KCK3_9DIPT
MTLSAISVPLWWLVVQRLGGVTGATTFDRLSPMAPIVGGTEVKDGMAPYLAGLVNQADRTFCGGSIISDRWILTAAHCLGNDTVNNTVVYVGSNDFMDNLGRKSNIIDRAIPHEGFVPETVHNDIALLRMNTSLKFGKRVQTIELATDIVPINASLTIVGWGRINIDGEYPKRTQILTVKSIGLIRCENMLLDMNNTLSGIIYDGNLCTFSKPGEGACKGDSGSPVIRNGKQVAVVSWGIGCAEGYPDAHASINYFHEWIQQTIAANMDQRVASIATNYIIGGSDAKKGVAPYQVSLQLLNASVCSGSIVADRWILTAAHCFRFHKMYSFVHLFSLTCPVLIKLYFSLPNSANLTHVLAGTNDLEKGGTAYAIDRVFPHDPIPANEDDVTFPNDIALIRLTTPVKFSERVQTIEYTAETVPENAAITLTGWGRTQNAKYSTKLQTMKAVAIGVDRCRELYGNLPYFNDGYICSLAKRGQGVCSGDSGGPVTWHGKLVGIMRSVFKKCSTGAPDMHTSISYYYDWIRETIANNTV